jgi:catechol 2,3-dioxygenase-like lactoylglutathione lyase family enzyme
LKSQAVTSFLRRAVIADRIGHAVPPGIDHIVIAVRNLDDARASFARLGFTVTPKSAHPFGTANALVQLQGCYIELLCVQDPARIPEPTPTGFSFAAFNRDFLEWHEGLSMLVLRSRDVEQDHQWMSAAGLPTYDIARFARMARGPDGIEREVAFSLAFTSHDAIPDAGFFYCQHHFPQNFWRAEYQHHDNGAFGIAEIQMRATDPAAIAPFLRDFAGATGVDEHGAGLAINTGGGIVSVVPDARAMSPHFASVTIAVQDIDRLRHGLLAVDVPFELTKEAIAVPAAACHGVAFVFSDVASRAATV